MSEFVKLEEYLTVTEAEINATFLHNAGIPAIVQGPQAGFFGGGFSGAFVQGIALMVPDNLVDEAKKVLNMDRLHLRLEE